MKRVLWTAGLVVAAVTMGLWVDVSQAYVEGPPPAVTGGFGEESCRMCHIDYTLNDSSGSLRVDGIPETYETGVQYPITVRLSHPQLERGGFELAARYASGSRAGQQAGSLDAVDLRTAVIKATDGTVQYARQTRNGSSPPMKGSIEWKLQWRAPETADSPVVFHAAANAANYDDSPLGDFPYTLELRTRPK